LNEAGQHGTDTVAFAKNLIGLILTDELHGADGLDVDGDLTCFTSGLRKALAFLSRGKSIRPFSDERYGLTSCP